MTANKSFFGNIVEILHYAHQLWTASQKLHCATIYILAPRRAGSVINGETALKGYGYPGKVS
jgi:hypothetical protein